MGKNKEEILKQINTDIEALLSIQERGLSALQKKADDIKLQNLREKISAAGEVKPENDVNS